MVTLPAEQDLARKAKEAAEADNACLLTVIQDAAHQIMTGPTVTALYFTLSNHADLEREVSRWIIALGAETSRHAASREQLTQASLAQTEYR